uniref:Hypoxia-inducible factor 1 n=1 Tax=Tubulanus polymorphus TaxID=672921 RepID=A0AA96HC20_9BILA|nr:hypoxia-inducible factor 1 [Tubulanus polymorphus]
MCGKGRPKSVFCGCKDADEWNMINRNETDKQDKRCNSSVRNTEKRKEKSRDAARCRRGKETEIFTELADQLPIPQGCVISQLDKASIMRLAISYLKIRTILGTADCPKDDDVNDFSDEDDLKYEQQYLKAMNGFLMVVEKDGDMIYVSDNVKKYFGIPQVDIIGLSIYEFSHPCDHDEIREMLLEKPHQLENSTDERQFFMRMKCTLTNKGKNVNLKSATYKVVRCQGHMLPVDQKILGHCVVLVGEPIPHPSNINMPLDSKTFLSKHNMGMKFIYCDERISKLLGYNSDELVGKSVYEYHHASDGDENEKAFKNLFSKGQATTHQYRFLAKGGGFAWLITQASVIYNTQTQKPQSVACLNYVISEIIEPGLILSQIQISEEKDKDEPPAIVMSTDKIFVQRTKDMEKDFFMPKDQTSLDLDDLTHLAPTAGDVCIPLGFPSSPNTLLNDFEKQKTNDNPDEEELVALSIKTEPFLPLDLTDCSRDCCTSPESDISDSSPVLVSPISPPSAREFVPGIMVDKENAPRTPPRMCESPIDSLDYEKRAPFIPDDDWMFTPATHSIFKNPPPEIIMKPQKPKHMMTLSTMLRPPDTSSIVKDKITRTIDLTKYTLSTAKNQLKLIQQKRQTVGRRLAADGTQTGQTRKSTGEADERPKTERIIGSSGGSVLMNLLLRGEDRNHGYTVESLLPQHSNVRVSAMKRKHSAEGNMLPQITRRDAEVNAPMPVFEDYLLRGQDLLSALDLVDII